MLVLDYPTQNYGVHLFISYLPVIVEDTGFDPLPTKFIKMNLKRIFAGKINWGKVILIS